MASPCGNDDCDRVCSDHKTMDLLIEQHGERISSVEDMSIDISNDISNLEGRVNMFIWVIGLVFMVLCSIAFYGTVQINNFKDIYLEDTVAMNKAISELKTTVDISAERIKDVKKEVKDIKAEVE